MAPTSKPRRAPCVVRPSACCQRCSPLVCPSLWGQPLAVAQARRCTDVVPFFAEFSYRFKKHVYLYLPTSKVPKFSKLLSFVGESILLPLIQWGSQIPTNHHQVTMEDTPPQIDMEPTRSPNWKGKPSSKPACLRFKHVNFPGCKPAARTKVLIPKAWKWPVDPACFAVDGGFQYSTHGYIKDSDFRHYKIYKDPYEPISKWNVTPAFWSLRVVAHPKKKPQVWLSVLLLGLLLVASLVVLPDIRHMPRENSDSARWEKKCDPLDRGAQSHQLFA